MSNLLISASSFTNDFTTLTPLTFSCTTLFNLSYVLNTFSKIGWTVLAINISKPPSIGEAIKNINATLGFIVNDMTRAQIIVIGALTAPLIIIINAICTFVTSVVSLVTILDVLNLSILKNEYFCIFSYISWRKFLANPADAIAAFFPDCTPKNNDKSAVIKSSAPIIKIAFVSFALTPSSINFATKNGIVISIATSNIIKIGVKIVGFLYSLIDFSKCFIIDFSSFYVLPL